MLQINNYNSAILKDISLELTNSTIILGSNGSGKSTLAKVMVGLIENNNVVIHGEKQHELSRKDKIKKNTLYSFKVRNI